LYIDKIIQLSVYDTAGVWFRLPPVLGEGLAEFPSLTVSQTLLPDSTYKKRIAQKVKAIKDFKPLPFTRIRTEKDFHNRELYVCYFAPFVHMAVQKAVGEKATWEWMQQIPTRHWTTR